MKKITFSSTVIGLLLLPIASYGFSFNVTTINETCSGNGTLSFSTLNTNPNGSIVYFVYKLPNTATPIATISGTTLSGLVAGQYKIIAKETVGNTVTTNEKTVTILSQIIALTYTITSLNNECSNLRDIAVNVTTGNAVAYEIFQGPITIPLQTSNIFHNLPLGEYQIRVYDNCGVAVVTTFTVAIYRTKLNFGNQVISNTSPFSCNSVIASQTISAAPGNSISYPLTVNYTLLPPNNADPIYITNTITNGNPASVSLSQTIPLFANNNYTYAISITDNCGNISSKNFNVSGTVELEEILTPTNCSQTSMSIQALNYTAPYTLTFNQFPNGFHPNTANSQYPGPYSENGVAFGNAPSGEYTITILDACGKTATVGFYIEPTIENKGIDKQQRPGCELNKGSIKLTSKNGKLNSVTLTAAPISAGLTLPYNANAYITTEGKLYMNNLIPGDYTFTCVDECNFVSTETVAVIGYEITKNTIKLDPNCGSFNLRVNFASNGNAGQLFWLQKLINPATNTWGNPYTNEIYPEGSLPNLNNSCSLKVGLPNYNFAINGTFRVVRYFKTFNNGIDINNNTVSSIDKDCLEILSPTVSFNQALAINDIYRLPCSSSGSLDVVVVANGTSTLHYKVVKKNGLAFVLDNGNSAVFTNLAPATYTFEVEDSCGNKMLRLFDVSALVPLANITTPTDMHECAILPNNNANFNLNSQTPIILGNQNANDYSVTYFTSLINAQNNSNPVLNPSHFTATNSQQTIFARLIFNQLPNCYQITSFKIITNVSPKITLTDTYSSCNGSPIELDASVGNTSTATYLWSTGATTPKITISEEGENHVSVIVTNTDGVFSCTNSKDITIFISQKPKIDHIDIAEWNGEKNSITIHTTTNATLFLYSINGINFQEENYFNDVDPNLYTVYVKDKGGCGVAQRTLWVLNYPKYFTPNNDGQHDTWFIKNLNNEPDFKIEIFNRFGTTLANLDSKSTSWDGTYNGTEQPSDDYWFIVYRHNEEAIKGHFTLKR